MRFSWAGVPPLFVIYAALAAGPAAADGFRAAAGAVSVTPPQGAFLAGYGRDRRSTGVLDDVWVKTVVVEAGGAGVALVTLDSIGLTRPDVERIRRGVAAQRPELQVVVSSTHTHSGPDVVGLWGSSLWRSGRDTTYVDSLVDRAVVLVLTTAAAVEPVSSRVVSQDVPLEWVENVSEPGLLDRRLSVLQFLDADGRSLATLTNYACHPTVLGPDNTLVSADYVAGFYETMAARLGGENLFLQGAIGGWVQPLQGDRSVDLAQDHGRRLAAAALSALDEAVSNPYEPMAFNERTVDVTLENWGFRLMLWLGVLERPTYNGAMRTSVTWFRLGLAEFVTHPGETSPAYSLASREMLSSPFGFVMGLSQDAMGYILKPDYFAHPERFPHGDYLVSVSAGPTAGPRIMAALRDVVGGE
jgi:hypothetical protein